MSAIILPRRRRSQPVERRRLDLSYPGLAGVSNVIVMYGGGVSGLGNRATGDQLSSPIGNATAYGTFDHALTGAGPAAAFDGTSNYVEYSPTNIPTSEFTLLWGGVFDANDSPRGFIDCTDNGVSGWNIYQGGGSTLYFNNSSYPAGNPSTGWTVGQFFHGALRNKNGVSCNWFRDGANIYTGTGVNPATPTLPFWIGRLKVGGLPYLKARISYLYLLDKFLDEETIARIAANPYIIFTPRQQVYTFDTSSGGPLTGSNCTEASSSSTGAVSQGHILAGSNCSEGSVSSTGAVTSGGTLIADNCTEASASATGAVTQGHILAGANCTEASASSTGAVAGAGVLAADSCTEASSSSTGTITQNHALTGANCAEDSASSTGAVLASDIILTAYSCIQYDVCSSGAISQVINTAWILNTGVSAGWVKDSSTTNTWS